MPPTPEIVKVQATNNPRLKRSSWKVEAIRRGEIKISGPLPLPGGEDASVQSESIHLNPPVAPPAPGQFTNHNDLSAVAFDLENDSQQGTREGTPKPDSEVIPPASASSQQNSSVDLRPINDAHRHTMPDMSASNHKTGSSTARSATVSPGPAELPPSRRKRQSGIGGLFKRMFSRRGRRDSKLVSAASPKHGYSQSDPGALAQATKKPTEAPKPPVALVEPRTLEPVQELHTRTPLRSHLPFPMNVNAPDETSPTTEEVSLDEEPLMKRRRATLPSVVFNSAEVSALAAIWSQSGTKVTEEDEEALVSPVADSEIGIALSSPTQAFRSHRRSRSAGALRELARQQSEHLTLPIPTRRRSAEIRYWRESVGARSMSVYSEADATAIDKAAVPSGRDEVVDDAVLDKSDPTTTAMESQQMQGFNFGDLGGNVPATAPIKVSKKAVSGRHGSNSSASIHTTASEPTRQFTSTRKPQSIVLDDAPKGKRSSRQRSSSTVRENFSRPSSIREAHATETLPPPRPSTATAATAPSTSTPQASFLASPSTANTESATQPLVAPAPTPNPIVDSALDQEDDGESSDDEREVDDEQRTSVDSADRKLRSTANNDIPSPSTQFHAIYTILRHERSARKALEKNVLSLQREVNDLRALTSKLSRAAASYPTPSPDQIYGYSQAHEQIYHTPHVQQRHYGHDPEDEGLGRSMGYDAAMHGIHQHQWEAGFEPSDRRRETAVSRFSKFDTDDEDASEDVRPSNRASTQSHLTSGTLDSDVLVMKSARAGREPVIKEKDGSGSEGSGKSVGRVDPSESDFGASPEVWETPMEESHGFTFNGRAGNGNGHGHGHTERAFPEKMMLSPAPTSVGEDEMF